MHRTLPLAALLVAALVTPSLACLWDHETLKEEKSRFPTAHELVSNQFPRHSSAYYQWRVEDRLPKVEADPNNLPLRDDLGVGLEKLGKHELAIELMEGSLEIDPDRYETQANLGTFLIHAGRYQDGLKHIDRAIEINPDAHFGREIYPRHLVAFVLENLDEAGKPKLPLQVPDDEFMHMGFASYLAKALGNDNRRLNEAQQRKAVTGILGMMRFSNPDHPILNQALGDVLVNGPGRDAARRLACRAYLKASYNTADERAAAAYRKLAEGALSMQLGKRGAEVTLDEIEEAFEQELAKGQELMDRIIADEAAWIADSKAVDALYAAKYRQAPRSKKR